MPQHKSAIKRVRQSASRRQQNRMVRSKMRTLQKKVFNTTDKEEAELYFKEACSYIDRMTTKGILHRNNAGNKKAQLAKYVNNL